MKQAFKTPVHAVATQAARQAQTQPARKGLVPLSVNELKQVCGGLPKGGGWISDSAATPTNGG